MPRHTALLTALVLTATVAAAGLPTEWTWQNPTPQGNDLDAVWGVSADEVYAIGGQQTVLRWDGSQWSVSSRPQSMPLSDLWGLDSGELWAVGWFGAVERFQGGTWSSVPFTPGANLVAVIAFADDDVVVAERFPGRRLWRYDGAQWTQIGTAPDGIHDLGGTSSSDLWVVGFEGMMSHYDGAIWTPVTGFPFMDITSVWALAPDDVFALLQGAQLHHFNGEDWNLVGADATGAWRSGLWASSAEDVWFVDQSGGISHYDGLEITPHDLPVDGLVSVWGDGQGRVHTVGDHGSLATFDDGAWTVHSTSVAYEDLDAVWAVSDDDIYAVGSLEIAVHWDGDLWTPIRDTQFSVWFTDVWAADAGNVFVTGKAGIQHYDGQQWTFMDDGLRHLLLPQNGIWGWGADSAVAVAAWGAIVRYDGLQWSIERQPDPGQGELNAVWGAAPDDIWAVGPADEFLHWDGLSWSTVTVTTGGVVRDILGFATDDIWVLGDGGAMLHHDGAQWTPVDDLVGSGVTDLHGPAADDIYAVSNYGYVWHYDGEAWTQGDTGARTGLSAIWGRPDGQALVVGDGGSVLAGITTITDTPEFSAGDALNLRGVPNPFNPQTRIRFEMPRAGHARLEILDVAGRRLATLLDGPVPAGTVETAWDGRDATGRALASGVYLAHVRTDRGRQVQKLTLVQ